MRLNDSTFVPIPILEYILRLFVSRGCDSNAVYESLRFPLEISPEEDVLINGGK